MIGSLRGTLLERDPAGREIGGEVLVEVAGVGYRLVVGPSTSVRLGEVGDEVFVHVHHHIREDAQTLYGFATREERVVFGALLSAHGVGPALALAILSVHAPGELRRVLAEDDIAALCLVPGVGKKTAARLLVELKARLDLPDTVDVAVVGGSAPAAASALADVREALGGLGYGPDEIKVAMGDLDADGDPSELLKVALQRLAGA